MPEPLNSWDLVQVLRVNNVNWMSGPKGTKPSPHGYWSVVNFIGAEAVLAKDGTLIRIPVSDIKRVGASSLEHVFEKLANAGKAKNPHIDMIDVISINFKWDYLQAKMFLRRYGLPLEAKNETHKEKLLERARQVAEDNDDYDNNWWQQKDSTGI